MLDHDHDIDRATADALLRVNADHLDAIESDRIGHENRYRSLTQTWIVTNDAGEEVTHGLGLPEHLPQVQQIAAQIDRLREQEKHAARDLERVMKDLHYLGKWAIDTHGIGMKQGARLIAAVGDPASRQSVRQLYSYLGLHVVPHPDDDDVGIAPFHQRGRKSNWNSQGQARVHMIADSCIKQTGPRDEWMVHLWCPDCRETRAYTMTKDDPQDAWCERHDKRGTKRRSVFRDIYDEGRVKYRFANHQAFCRRCGPSGSPAEPGSPLSDGHKHARALRLVKKAVVKDMWRAARATLPDGGEQQAEAA